MLNDTRIRRFGIGIINHGIALIVLHTFQQFGLERHSAILQMAIPIVKVTVNLTCINYLADTSIKFFFLIEIVNT